MSEDAPCFGFKKTLRSQATAKAHARFSARTPDDDSASDDDQPPGAHPLGRICAIQPTTALVLLYHSGFRIVYHAFGPVAAQSRGLASQIRGAHPAAASARAR